MAHTVVMLSEEEYQELLEKIEKLEEKLWWTRVNSDLKDRRIKDMWETVNRPAIEESAKRGEEEFLDWCSDMADKYDRIDEEEWLEEKARMYNNGLNFYADSHHIPRDMELIWEHKKYPELQFAVWEPAENGWDIAWEEAKKDCWCAASYMPYHLIYHILSEYHTRWMEAFDNKRYAEAKRIDHLRDMLECMKR